ncbi:MAG: hypothetical protein DRP92_01385 [Candidatus Neomarinimicrobiota bacterium]|nr:MAG: hypothetical protein DRP92_01385 [Candidatus Neomarinimicrobiota bacterium]
MAKSVPGIVDEDVRENDYVWGVINTVDNRLDDVLGIRPLRLVGRALTAIAPANVIRNVTGIEKPSELVEEVTDSLDSELKGLRIKEGGLLRKLRR